jgi:hypothetical protein
MSKISSHLLTLGTTLVVIATNYLYITTMLTSVKILLGAYVPVWNSLTAAATEFCNLQAFCNLILKTDLRKFIDVQKLFL